MKAIVLGSTGLVGSKVVEVLCSREEISQVILLNRRKAGMEASTSKIVERVVDFDRPDTYRPYMSESLLFCCLGSTMKKAQSKKAFRRVDFQIPLETAEVFAKNQNATMAVVTALGANASSLFFYNRTKGELERELEDLPLKKLIIVKPSLLLGERARGDERKIEQWAQKLAPFYSKLLPSALRPVNALDVARAMVEHALDSGSTTPVSRYIQTRIFEH